MKFVPWTSAPNGALYHWCPACESLHPIPAEGWTRSGTDEAPTYSPSFGQHTKRGYCHYNITDGALVYHVDSYHAVRGTVALPEIPDAALQRLNGGVGVSSDAVFRRRTRRTANPHKRGPP